MTLLIFGVVLFAVVHFIPSLAPNLKNRWISSRGENGYKGIFSLALLVSFGLMITGWRSAEPQYIYATSPALHTPALLLMCVAFVLLAASNLKTRIRLWVRHPQLTGVAVWALAHMLLNGDNRSLVLFGGLGLWALVSIFAINKREGVWVKEEAPALYRELVLIAVTGITMAIVVFIHPWLSGMPAV